MVFFLYSVKPMYTNFLHKVALCYDTDAFQLGVKFADANIGK